MGRTRGGLRWDAWVSGGEGVAGAVAPSLPRASREACAMWGEEEKRKRLGETDGERHALHLSPRTDFLVQEAGNLGRLVVVGGGDDVLSRARVLHLDLAHHVPAHGHGGPGQAEEEDGAPSQHGGGGQAETAAASRDVHG